MSDNDRIIRNARLAERNRRNNSWGEAPVLAPRLTDQEILGQAQKLSWRDQEIYDYEQSRRAARKAHAISSKAEHERIMRRLCAL